MAGDAETPLDVLLVDLWAEVFRRPVSIRDSLASLRATPREIDHLAERVARATGTSVHAHEWNPPGTIEALAAVLARAGGPALGAARRAGAAKRPRVLARNTGGDRPPLVFAHGDFNGAGFYCLALAARLGPDQPFHALAPHGLDGVPVPGSIEEMAEDYLVTLREIQPRGPYRLGGHCNGGLVAYEMARHLEARGEEVSLLLLVAADVLSTAVVRPPAPGRPLSGRRLVRYYWRRFRETVATASRYSRTGASGNDRSRGEQAVAERARANAERFDAYLRAMLAYRPGPFGGRTVLLWPQSAEDDGHPGDPTHGWGAVAKHLEILQVPGGHLSCVTTHVDAVAAELRRALDRSG